MVLKRKANIIITGTPGTGKSSHIELLKKKLPELTYVDIKDVIKEHDCVIDYDDERKADIVDEDKVVDALEDKLDDGNLVIDWHVCDAFPESQIDLVVVLRTDNSILYERLKDRKYNDQKINENIDAEIMEVILNDAREQYDEEIIVSLDSNKESDIEENVDRIIKWYDNWNADHPHGVSTIDNMPNDSSDSDSD